MNDDPVSIADEQIFLWKSQGITADEAWRAMGLNWAWAVEWYEVRAQMVRWLRFGDGGGLKQGPLPAARPRPAA